MKKTENISAGRRFPEDFIRFAAAVALFGFGMAIVNAVFNNYLSETFQLGASARGMLEFPRELPGFLVVFISAAFFFLSSRRLAALAHLFAGVGVYLLGHYSSSYSVMLIWLFIYSMGQHIFLPLVHSIGMEFADDGKAGKRLGQITGANNVAVIAGSFVVFAGFRYFNFNFPLSFSIAAAVCIISAILLFSMKPDETYRHQGQIILRREYGLFYWLNILYGTRKQIFLTFAPWVLVTVFNQSTAMVATLFAIGGIIGIAFNPLLGMAIDRFGERFILMSEAVVLVFVCFGYGFSKNIFPEKTAFIIAASCFILDQLLMSVSMARSTYLKKIAVNQGDIAKTLTMGVTIDHFFSIAVALVSGIVWARLGYQYVFMLGGVIAIINFFSASRIRVANNN